MLKYQTKDFFSHVWLKLGYFIITLILMTVIFTLFNYWNGLGKLGEVTISDVKPIITLEINNQEISESFDSSEKVTFNDLDFPSRKTLVKIGKMPQIQKYDLSLSSVLYTEGISNIDNEGNSKYGIFTLKGTDRSDLFDDYINVIQFVEGKMLNLKNNDINQAIISETVAKKNNLNIGDKVTINASGWTIDEREVKFPIELIISGFFSLDSEEKEKSLSKITDSSLEHNSKNDLDSNRKEDNDETDHHSHSQTEELVEQKMIIENHLVNTIYVSNKFIEDFNKKMAKQMNVMPDPEVYQAKYLLKNRTDLKSFTKEAFRYISKPFSLQNQAQEYLAMTGHRQSVKTAVLYSLIICLLIFIILQVIMLKFMRNTLFADKSFFLFNGFDECIINRQVRGSLYVLDGLAVIFSAFLSFLFVHFNSDEELLSHYFAFVNHEESGSKSNMFFLSKDLVSLDSSLAQVIHIDFKVLIFLLFVLAIIYSLIRVVIKIQKSSLFDTNLNIIRRKNI